MKIVMAKERVGPPLTNRRQLLRICREAARLAGLDAQAERDGVATPGLCVNVVGPDTIKALNEEHLGHDWVTDVIAFALPAGPVVGGEPTLIGELYICAAVAVDRAVELGVDPTRELALYIVHGCLHLAGMDDQTDGDREAMRRAERETLAAIGGTIALEGVL